MSTTTTHNTTTTNNAGFPPAPGETHQETNFEPTNCEFSLYFQVRSPSLLKAAAMAHPDAAGMTVEDFENEDGSVDLRVCLRTLLDPSSLPGCVIFDSAIEAGQ
jgi:hypothetical protein